MKNKTWLFMVIAALLACGLLAGCAQQAPAQADTGSAELANPWVDATADQAATLLGGTFYNFTTLDGAYKQYALLITTDAAMNKQGLKPTAWVRFKKGEQDVSLQMFMGGKLDTDQLKGAQADMKGAIAYVTQSADGTSHIAWEANGLLYEISTSTAWSNDALLALAQGVKAAS
jgi:hypothetical protein